MIIPGLRHINKSYLLAASLWVSTSGAVPLLMSSAVLSAETKQRLGDLPSRAQIQSTSRIAPNTVTYSIGDRLKVTFFEQLQKVPSAQQTDVPLLSSFIERPELAGEYVVEQDGSILFPLLGSIQAVERSPRELEQLLSEASAAILGGSIKVSIQFIDREPVYVTGPLLRPGAFKHVPGMTVLHALTLAGGVERNNADQWRLLDVAREEERLRKSEARLKKLQVRLAVLRAEREGHAPTATDQLISLVGPAEAEQLIVEEERLRKLDRERVKAQRTAFNKAILATYQEMSLAGEKVVHIRERVKDKAERRNAVEALRTKGTTTDINLALARSEYSDAQERLHEAQATVAQMQRKLAEVQLESIRVEVDMDIGREQEIKEIVNSAAEESITRTVIGSLLKTGTEFASKSPAHGLRQSYTIVRRTSSGVTRMLAEDVSALQPGDIVQVQAADPAIASN